MMWKARFSMAFHVKLRYVLKTLTAAAWVIVLPITYSYSLDNPSGFGETMKNWFGNGSSSSSLFILAIVVYLSPNMVSALLFLLPFVRRYLERSDYRIVRFIMWWSQVHNNFYQLIPCCSSLFFFFPSYFHPFGLIWLYLFLTDQLGKVSNLA